MCSSAINSLRLCVVKKLVWNVRIKAFWYTHKILRLIDTRKCKYFQPCLCWTRFQRSRLKIENRFKWIQYLFLRVRRKWNMISNKNCSFLFNSQFWYLVFYIIIIKIILKTNHCIVEIILITNFTLLAPIYNLYYHYLSLRILWFTGSWIVPVSRQRRIRKKSSNMLFWVVYPTRWCSSPLL